MPATLDEVKQVIQDAFPGSSVDDVQEERGRVIGTIRWEGFSGKGSGERNQLVTEKVRNKLGLRGVNVGILFPRVPGENP